jgi:hypothetical protein
MSANSTDLRLFFEAKIGGSFRLGLDDESRQTDDTEIGAIPPGKYFVQVLGLDTGETCHIRSGKWVKGATITAVATAAPAAGVVDLVNEFPLAEADGVSSFVLHVRQGINDRIAAILTAGTATLVITKTGD